MRILYVDIDTLRPDHLGCYGYRRNTSPNIDSVARDGAVYRNCYTSDAPCLPSRTALFSGRYGIHTGVVDHGGIAADPFIEGAGRRFTSELGRTSFSRAMKDAGIKVCSISPFAERHSAWWWTANFSEFYDPGKRGQEIADDVEPIAVNWLERNCTHDNWLLHVHYWDPHTPYRTPDDYGTPFADDPLPEWHTQQIIDEHLLGAGPESASEPTEFQAISAGRVSWTEYPRQPTQMRTTAEARKMYDGYDTAIRYVDDSVGRLFDILKQKDVFDDTVVVISSDHGENLGEQNIYAAHMTADDATIHIPLIVKFPGVTEPGRIDPGLHYHIDFAASLVELCGGTVPPNWDGESFADALKGGSMAGREFLVCSHMAGSCQRAVRFGEYLYIRSYHDGYHCLPDRQLFDLGSDPHQLDDLAAALPETADKAARFLDMWMGEQMRKATHPQDPMWTVMNAGGPEHTRGCLPGYLERLRNTGRNAHAEMLEKNHPREV